jgi:hypothetical protein
MREISLSIPTLESEQNIDIEVRINGKRRSLRYRVEIIAWEDAAKSDEDRVDVLKRVIREYDKDWQLVQVGAPMDKTIPIMFRKTKNETEA